MHPYLAQPELKAYCDSKGILIQAYTPTGRAVVRLDKVKRPSCLLINFDKGGSYKNFIGIQKIFFIRAINFCVRLDANIY